MEAKPATFVSKISATETLKSLKIDKPYKFPTSIFKSSTIRATVLRLKKRGYNFEVTEAGLINEVQVTRLK